MSGVMGEGTVESAKGRSPADIYAVTDGERRYSGIMAGHKARHVLWPTLSAWLAARSEAKG